jgi:LPPG:FO 2-phospho-L-lactate transferase
VSPAPSDRPGPVVLLSGGTGGAKLALGMLEELGSEGLVVIANTGDDIEIHGALVSPDPDLVSFWLAGLIDERGWGIAGDTFAVMDELRARGEDVWFNLGDRDLGWCLRRTSLMAEGATATEALAALNASIGQPVPVLPMSDAPVRTWISTPQTGWRGFQEYMIRGRAAGPVDGVEFRGAGGARPSEDVLVALATASAIVIGPSNPLASIGPILSVPGIAEAMSTAAAPVVAVSPIVGGEVLKGPTASFMSFAGRAASASGVAGYYGELIDAIVADEDVPGLPALQIETRMDDPAARAAVARQTIDFARSLSRVARD